jgi:alpha-tubulin suppressor-like RCC1 family protein
VSCWGEGTFGALGNGGMTDSPMPVAVTGLDDATDLRVGGYYSCALRRGGTVVCWGYGLDGNLGDGTSMTRFAPGPDVVGVSGVRELSTALQSHTCVIEDTGSVRCWGNNDVGQIGDGTSMNTRPTAVTVMGLP